MNRLQRFWHYLTSSNSSPAADSTSPMDGSKYGIIEWQKPDPNTQATPIDIVFVHGLFGKSDTWKHPDSEEPWPKTLLHKSVPHARILTFKYDADIVNLGESASQNRIDEHARNLNLHLRNYRVRTRTQKQDIYFVVHSLGGIVLKNALWRSHSSPDQGTRLIIANTKGVMFLGTPHAGADAAKFAKFIAGFTSVIRPTANEVIGVLERDSETLANLTRSFHEMLRVRQKDGLQDIQMACFAEELPVQRGPLSHTVVTKESATIPGYEIGTIHADHIMMTKFEKEDDDGYRLVEGQLLTWLDDEVETKPERAAEAVRKAWNETEGRKSGPINQGGVSISGSSIVSGRDSNIGNVVTRK